MVVVIRHNALQLAHVMQIKRTNRVKRAARAKGRRKGKTPKNLLYQNPKAIKDDTFKEK